MKTMIDGYLQAKATGPNIEAKLERDAAQRAAGRAEYWAEEAGRRRAEINRLSAELESAKRNLNEVGTPDHNGLGAYIWLRVRAFRDRRLVNVKDWSTLSLEDKRVVNLQMIAVTEYLNFWLETHREYPKYLSAVLAEEVAKPEIDRQRLSAVSEALAQMAITGRRQDEKDWIKARLRGLKDQIRYAGPADTLPVPASLGNPFPSGLEFNVLIDDPIGISNLLLL